MRGRLLFGTVALAALVSAGCGSSSKTSNASTGGGTTTTTAPATSGDPYGSPATTTTTGAAGTSATTVKVATDSKLGQILVGGDGRTLYLFEKDQGTTTACTGGCPSVWPALTSSTAPTGGPGVTASLLSTANGQVTYNGHLLYFYAGDKSPGETNGTLVASWFAVSPAGNKAG